MAGTGIGPLGLTFKQEKFCRKLVENDLPATDAYKAAGYETTADSTARAAASRLMNSVNIKLRIEQLQADAAYAAAISIVSIARELDQAWKLAFVNKQAVGCVQASLAKAKLFGFVNDKPQVAVNQQHHQVTHIHLVAPDDNEQVTLLDGDFSLLPHPLEQE